MKTSVSPIRVLATLFGITIAFATLGCSSPTNSTPAAVTIPLIGGNVNSTVSLPGYWSNGTWNQLDLPTGETNAEVNAITASGSKIYAAGNAWITTTTPDLNVPGYWLNGTWTSLPLPTTGQTNGIVNDIVVSGTNVYAAGDCWVTTTVPYPTIPGYWLNDNWTPLTLSTGETNGEVYGLVIAGSNIYAVGESGTSSTSTPGYWLNGTWTALNPPSGAVDGVANKAVVSGSNVYVSGYSWNSSNNVDAPGYWINGTWTALPLPTGATSGNAYSIVVSGSNVYVGGQGVTGTGATAVYSPLYWTNGTLTSLPVPSADAGGGWVNRIAISGSNIIAIGGCAVTASFTSVNIPGYWLNGTWTPLPVPSADTNGGYASSAASSQSMPSHFKP